MTSPSRVEGNIQTFRRPRPRAAAPLPRLARPSARHRRALPSATWAKCDVELLSITAKTSSRAGISCSCASRQIVGVPQRAHRADGRRRRGDERALQALPLLTAYRDLGFAIADFPNALAQFENEVDAAAAHVALRRGRGLRGGIVQARPDGLEAEGVR